MKNSKPTPSTPPTLTVTEAAERLKVSPLRVRQFIRDGRLKARFANIWLIDGEDFQRFSRIKRTHGISISSPEKR